MTANIARTATRALAAAVLPTLKGILRKGLDTALQEDRGLAAGLYLYKGAMVNETLGATLEIPTVELQQLIDRGDEQ
jgi:alanine dehydrogenase